MYSLDKKLRNLRQHHYNLYTRNSNNWSILISSQRRFVGTRETTVREWFAVKRALFIFQVAENNSIVSLRSMCTCVAQLPSHRVITTPQIKSKTTFTAVCVSLPGFYQRKAMRWLLNFCSMSSNALRAFPGPCGRQNSSFFQRGLQPRPY